MLLMAWIFTFLSLIPSIAAILEDDIHYDINWLAELPTTPIDHDNQVLFMTKRKEKYSCVLPTLTTTLPTSANTITLAEVQPFINEFYAKKSCTYRLDPYWSYELCHGSHLRQYHETKVAGKRAVTQEYFLGYYHAEEQDVQTNVDHEQVLKIHHKKINDREVPMLSVRYTDGTACEINANQPRETVIYYVCSESGNDAIVHFQEISSCYYEITVTSSWLCKLPAFSSAEPNRHSINCYAQENAVGKPRNLKNLEHERQLALKKGEGAQFTMTSADGTTFIISYDFVNPKDVADLTNTINAAVTKSLPEKPDTPPSGQLNYRDFLERFLAGEQCLTGGTGWWQYEFCYGKHVLQFHEEGHQQTSIVLGRWNHEQHVEWTKTNPKKRFIGNRKERQYVSLHYAAGDICPLTNTPRMVEVKLRCSKKTDKTSSLTSMYLVEPETCSYVLGVESPSFCNLIDATDEHGIPDLTKSLQQFQEQ